MPEKNIHMLFDLVNKAINTTYNKYCSVWMISCGTYTRNIIISPILSSVKKIYPFLWIFLDSISTLMPRIMAASYQSSARGLTSQTSSLNGGKDQENKFILMVEKMSWKAVIWVLRGAHRKNIVVFNPGTSF